MIIYTFIYKLIYRHIYKLNGLHPRYPLRPPHTQKAIALVGLKILVAK
jgi:hypothetical protein